MQFEFMKHSIVGLLLISAISVGAATERISCTLTVTNLPVTGDTLVINSVSRYWTNSATTTTFETNTTTLNSTTNLWNSMVSTPYAGNLIMGWLSSTSFIIRAQIGGALAVSGAGEWASFVNATQTVQQAYPVTVPLGNQLTASQATNIASQLVSDLSSISTNRFSTNSTVMLSYVPTNGVFYGHVSNSPSIRGTAAYVTNGYYTNATLDVPITTNLVNYGNAISSPGSGTASEEFGTGATATGNNSVAVGDTAAASAASTIAVGSDATVTGPYSIGIGDAPVVGGGYNIVLGNGSEAGGTNCIIIGNAIELTGTNTWAIGRSISSTATNTGILGDSAQNVVVPGVLNPAIITNTTYKGTNQVNGALGFTRTVSTAIADGNNTIAVADNIVYLSLTGSPSAQWTNVAMSGTLWDGRYLILENATGQDMVISHESGVEGIAARRILHYSGGDMILTGRRVATFIYTTATNRWLLVSP